MPSDRPTDNAAQTRALAADLYPRLLRFFRSKVPHPDCHDLAQQTFTEFLRQLRSKQIDNPRGYLWGVAHFQLLKFIDRAVDLVSHEFFQQHLAHRAPAGIARAN